MWKYLIKESPKIQSWLLFHSNISSSVPSAPSLLFSALKISLNERLLSELPRALWPPSTDTEFPWCWAPFGMRCLIPATWGNGFLLLGRPTREGTCAARRDECPGLLPGDRDAAKGCASKPWSITFRYLCPVSGAVFLNSTVALRYLLAETGESPVST